MRFEEILVYTTITSGIILILAKAKWIKLFFDKNNKIIAFLREVFPVLLLVVCLRSFLAEPFRIPSGSMKPTLLVGDFILVNKFIYGIRLPVIGTKLINISSPKRGDIVVFRQKDQDVIKRVIGLPGDHIKYVNKSLYINNTLVSVNFNKKVYEDASYLEQSQEQLDNLSHAIYTNPWVDLSSIYQYDDIVVPENCYFVLGDNRDNSKDSRFWGFVDNKDLIGKAFLIWMSWDSKHNDIRWDRIGSVK